MDKNLNYNNILLYQNEYRNVTCSEINIWQDLSYENFIFFFHSNPILGKKKNTYKMSATIICLFCRILSMS